MHRHPSSMVNKKHNSAMEDLNETRIFQPYERESRPAILLTGRSLDDLVVTIDKTDPARPVEIICPIRETIRDYAQQKLGMVVITFSLAGGIDWDEIRINTNDLTTIRKVLTTHKLDLDRIGRDEDVIGSAVAGFISLLKTPTEKTNTNREITGINTWVDGRTMRFLVLIEFAEHLFPCVQNGTLTRAQMITIESLHLLSKSLAFRKSGNYLVVHGRDGWVDELLTSGLHPVRLNQPNTLEIETFLRVVKPIYSQATFAPGLDDREIISLVEGTPIRPFEELIRASDRSGKTITANDLSTAKERSVTELSEGTLSILKTDRIKDLDLQGQNIQVAAKTLNTYAEALSRVNSGMPANLILVGPPGTAKTDLALRTAFKANAPTFQMHMQIRVIFEARLPKSL
jgi:hypothetical protein